MDAIDRIYDLFTILGSRHGPVSTRDLMEKLECSRPTLHRTLTHARDVYGVPIRNVRGAGYVFDRASNDRIELPGLWFSAPELEALLAIQAVVEELEPGILRRHVEPFRKGIETLLDKASPHAQRFPADRIRLLAPHRRNTNDRIFQSAASALIGRRRARIVYLGRERDCETERDVSPQRLVNYRNNWYLDGWCHLQDGLRTFALDRVVRLENLDEPSLDISREELDAHLTHGYGIFSGAARRTARLRFTRERARWVADEQWHPRQHGQFTTDGEYELEVPYSDVRELIGEVLRHGSEVEVLGPPSLRDAVARELGAAMQRYQPGPAG